MGDLVCDHEGASVFGRAEDGGDNGGRGGNIFCLDGGGGDCGRGNWVLSKETGVLNGIDGFSCCDGS